MEMFGHVLRMNKNTPSKKSIKHYFQVPQFVKYRRRKRATIVSTLNRDIERTKELNKRFAIPTLKSELDLRNTRIKALNRKHWQKIVRMLTNTAYSDIAF